MQILVLADARQPHTLRWIEALQATGADVCAASMQRPLETLPCEFVPLPGDGPGFLRPRAARAPLLGLAERWKPSLIAALFVPDYGWLGAGLKSALGGSAAVPRLCVAALGSDLLINARRTFLHEMRARRVLAAADVVAVDARMLADAAEKLGCEPRKIHRLDWLPDLGLFAFHPDKPEHPVKIVSTRQLAPLYDVRALIDAMPRLFLQRGGEIELVIVGDGPERSRLEERVRARGVPAKFTGRLDPAGLASQLGGSAIYVSTARSDSTSVSLLEAMACGAFPVVTDIPGNREWVTEGHSGLLFPPGNPGELTHQIARALDDRMLRERAVFHNRRRLEAIPTFQEGVRQLLSRFGSLGLR